MSSRRRLTVRRRLCRDPSQKSGESADDVIEARRRARELR
jgi:hypothetical protein